MTMLEKQQTEALQSILTESRRAEQKVVRLLDRLRAVEWPLEREILGDVLAGQENGLCHLNSHFSRIAILAEHAIPAYDEKAHLDELVDQIHASDEEDDKQD